MELLLLLTFSVLYLYAHAAPTKEQFFASTKDFEATLVGVPVAHFKGGCGNNNNPTTSAPSTTDSMAGTPTTPSSVGTPPSANGPPSGTGNCVSCAVENFNLVNNYRASNGLNTLSWNERLSNHAAQWSKEMYDTRFFRHSDLNYWENIIWRGGSYTWVTVAEGFFNDWRRSSGHDRNMRLSTHKCMGVGIYGDVDRFYGTQLFTDNCP